MRNILLVIALSFSCSTNAAAQNVNVTTPFQGNQASQFQGTGFHLGFGRGGPIPPFGGFDPNAGGRLNFNGPGFSFGLNFAQGSYRSSVTNSPSLTVMNGYGGSIYSGEFRPYLTGVIPVVGNNNQYSRPIDNAVSRALNSGQLDLSYRLRDENSDSERSTSIPNAESRGHADAGSSARVGDRSVAAIRSQRAREAEAKTLRFEESVGAADQLLKGGDSVGARIAYRAAMQLTDDDAAKKQLQVKIAASRD